MFFNVSSGDKGALDLREAIYNHLLEQITMKPRQYLMVGSIAKPDYSDLRRSDFYAVNLLNREDGTRRVSWDPL